MEDSPHGRFATWKIRHKIGELQKHCHDSAREHRMNINESSEVEDSPQQTF